MLTHNSNNSSVKEAQSSLLQRAQNILSQNHTGHFTKPAPSLYPHQWNWDSGFIAMGYAHYHPELAMAELRALFEGQWKNGMVPHIVFRERSEEEAVYFPGPDFWQSNLSPNAPGGLATSGISQPPVHGMALKRIAEISADHPSTKAFIEEMWPRVAALNLFFYRERNPEGNGLVVFRHPWESGTDNAPTWDVALARFDPDKVQIPSYQRLDLIHGKADQRPTQRDYDYYVHLIDIFRKCQYDEAAMQEACPFSIQDPLFNSLLLKSTEDLVDLGKAIGQDTLELEAYASQTRNSMNELLWNSETGLYHVRDQRTQTLLPHQVGSGFMPLMAGIPSMEQADRMVAALLSPHFSGFAESKANWLPTYDLQAPDFQPAKYWRGPVWVNLNWMLCMGLRRYGHDAHADALQEQTLRLVEQAGFYEYFHPYGVEGNPTGLGTHSFSWTAALVIDWLNE